MATPPAIQTFIQQREQFEADGRHATAVHLPAELAAQIRWELHQMYGFDPGEGLMTIYGVEVLSTDAPEVRFEE